MIFPDNETAAAISNIIWDLGTTAVTSASSSPDTCEGERVSTARFINETYPELVAETATGRGEHLTTVATLMGCAESSHSALIQRVRTDVAGSMVEPGYADLSQTEKAEQYFHAVDGAVQTEFADQCSAA